MNLCDTIRRLTDVAAAGRAVADYKAKYDALAALHLTTMRCLEDATAREAALQAALAVEREKVKDLGFHLECMSVDNADLERVNEALRGGLQFFDPSQGSAS